MKKIKILIIIPAYNEEESILSTYQTILNYNGEIKYDTVVINDGSLDRTSDICEENDINHVNLVVNLGIGGAVQTGYKYARDNDYDIAVQFDGDGQHDVNYIIDIIKPIINGEADMVVGSRFVSGSKSQFKSSFTRRMGIRMISKLIYLVTGETIKDVTSGFRACGRELINEYAEVYPIEYPEPISITKALLDKKTVKEVPVVMHERAGGKSSITSWKNIYYMINIFLSIFIIKLQRRDR